MKLFVTIILLFSVTLLNSQVKTHGVAFGAGAGTYLGDTEFGRDDQLTDVHGHAYFRHAVFGPFEGQLTGSLLGEISDETDTPYRTILSSVDYRLMLRPFTTRFVSPYFFGGFGRVFYDADVPAVNADPTIRDRAWVSYAPTGGGLQIGIIEGLSLDISTGYSFSFSDDLNLVRDGLEDDGYFMAGVSLTFTGSSGAKDRDGDGIADREEEKLGTNKKMADTDSDGLSDSEELYEYKTHPLVADTDNDGLDDKDEVLFYNTDPRSPDSDNDNLSDYDEIHHHKTNPLDEDSDGDRLSDGAEINVSKTDPLESDMDNDGLGDGVELVTHKTDPRNADSDNDGLRDGKEVLVYHTNPVSIDSDGDRLSDGEEVNQHMTDPLVADSDGGGTIDGEEVIRGTNPLSVDDDGVLKVAEVGAGVILDGIIFATSSATISPQSELVLEKALNTLVAYPDMAVEIRGYTDNTGSRAYNVQLSQKRAEAVKSWLVRKGVGHGRISALGFGPDNAIATNSTGEGRARNRRVEFVRTK